MPISTKALVFVELPGQIEPALKAMRRRGVSEFLIMALSPHVEYALEKKQLKFRRPDDYYREDELNAIGVEDVSNTEKLCDNVDRYLQSQWGILAEDDIQPMMLSWYSLKILLNSMSIRAFIMLRVIEQEAPVLIYYFGTKKENVSRSLNFIRESAWSQVIPVACSQMEVRCEPLGGNTDPRVLSRSLYGIRLNPAFKLKQIGWLILRPNGVRWVRAKFRGGMSVRNKFAPYRDKTGPSSRRLLIALDSSYSLGNLIRHILQRQSFDILRWDVHPVQSPFSLGRPIDIRHSYSAPGKKPIADSITVGRRIWADLNGLEWFRQYSRFSSIDCFPILESRWKQIFEKNIPELVDTYLKARLLLRRLNPVAVLTSTTAEYGRQAVALASQKENIPYTVYRHGESTGHVQMKTEIPANLVNTDLMLPKYVMAFGEGDVEFFNSGEKTKPQILPIGCAELDDLRRSGSACRKRSLLKTFGLCLDRKVVMYVPTDMESNIRVAPYRSRSPSLTFELQRKFLNVAEEFPEIQFVMKLHIPDGHACSPIAQLVKDRRPKNVVVITDSFMSVLSLADMFVTDYPSTSFLQMLTTDRPILLCGYKMPKRWSPGKWHPSILKMWQERVLYSDGLDGFFDLLRARLREGKFESVKSEDTLLKLFGTHLNDGKSVERAHDFLESLAR